jgi:hypothetical protein
MRRKLVGNSQTRDSEKWSVLATLIGPNFRSIAHATTDRRPLTPPKERARSVGADTDSAGAISCPDGIVEAGKSFAEILGIEIPTTGLMENIGTSFRTESNRCGRSNGTRRFGPRQVWSRCHRSDLWLRFRKQKFGPDVSGHSRQRRDCQVLCPTHDGLDTPFWRVMNKNTV